MNASHLSPSPFAVSSKFPVYARQSAGMLIDATASLCLAHDSYVRGYYTGRRQAAKAMLRIFLHGASPRARKILGAYMRAWVQGSFHPLRSQAAEASGAQSSVTDKNQTQYSDSSQRAAGACTNAPAEIQEVA